MYIVAMSAIVAMALALAFSGLKPIHDANEAVFKKRDILSAIKGQVENEMAVDVLNAPAEKVFSIFKDKVKQVVIDANGEVVEEGEGAGEEKGVADKIDMKQEEKKPLADRLYPVYVYQGDGENIYLVAVRGNGLWDKIWATVAIKEDFNTIAGISFDHVTETAGLGAEIKDNDAWKAKFTGKKLYNENNDFVSVAVVKGGVKIQDHQVDAIAGATITSDGVTEMMNRGLKIYEPYFESLKN